MRICCRFGNYLLVSLLFSFGLDAVTPDFFFNRKELFKAKATSNAILSENPRLAFSYDYMLNIGIYHYYAGQYLKAEKYFNKVLKYAADSVNIADVKYWLGKTYLNQKKQDKAIACFSRVSHYSKKPIRDFLLFYGISLYQVEMYDDAINCFLNYQAQVDLSKQPKELPIFIAASAIGNKDYSLSREILVNHNLQNDKDLYPIPVYLLALNYYLTNDISNSLHLLKKIVADSCTYDITDNARLILGAIYTEQNELSKAVKEFDAIIEDDQSQYKEYAYLRAGIGYYKLKQMIKATERFDSLLAQNPASSWADAAFYYKVKTLEQNRKWNKAQVEYRKFIANYPNSSLTEQASINLGRLLMQDENYLEAVPLYENFLKQYSQSLYRKEVLYNLFIGCYHLRQFTKAQNYGEEYVRGYKTGDKVFDVYYYLGQIGFAKSNREYARKYLSLITSGVWYAYAMKDIGDIYFKEDSLTAAINYYNLAEQTSKDSLIDEIRYNREKVYLKQGVYESELVMLRNFLEKYPNSFKSAEVQYQIGHKYLDVLDFNQALIEFDKVYNYSVRADLTPALEMDKAYCYERLNQLSEAVISYLKIINDYPKSNLLHKAMYRAATIYDSLENYDSAIVYYSRLITEVPKTEEQEIAYFRLASVYRKLNRYNEAANLLERYLLTFPISNKRKDAYFELVSFYQELNKFSLALKKIDEIFVKFGKSGQAYFQLATINIMENKISLAKTNFINAYNFYVQENKNEFAAISLLEAGKCAAQEKKYSEAKELFQRCVNLTQDERLRIECEKQINSIPEK